MISSSVVRREVHHPVGRHDPVLTDSPNPVVSAVILALCVPELQAAISLNYIAVRRLVAVATVMMTGCHQLFAQMANPGTCINDNELLIRRNDFHTRGIAPVL